MIDMTAEQDAALDRIIERARAHDEPACPFCAEES